MASNINMRGVQEGVEDSVKQARELGRKAMLASLGVAGMGFDLSKSLVKESSSWLSKAETRGEQIEKELLKVFNAYQKDLPGEVKKLAHNIEAGVTTAAKEVGEQGERIAAYAQKYVKGASKGVSETVVDIKVSAEEVVTKQSKKMADAAQDAMESVQIETPAAVEEAVESAQKVVNDALNKLWKGYDELGVKEIIAGLDGKSMSTLEKVREHELNGKNRVTVLREIDAKMQAMTS